MDSPNVPFEQGTARVEPPKFASAQQSACPLSIAAAKAQACDVSGTGFSDDLPVESCPRAEVLEQRLELERLLFELAASFVGLPSAEVDAQIFQSIQRLGERLAVDRISFADFSDNKRDLLIRHRYVAPGIEPYPVAIIDGTLPWYTEQVRKGEVVGFHRLPEDLAEEAVAEREHCTRVGLKSHVTIPLMVGGELKNVLTFATFREYRTWPVDLIQRLRLLGQVFANALIRR